MSANLPAIFIELCGHCGGVVPGLPDMWNAPEGKFVRATDYLALKEERDRLAREVKLLFSDT